VTKFSANLGFLWNDLSLPDAIRAAKQAGFDAVECHWPYEFDAQEVKAALEETGIQMLGLNTVRGNLDAGENGLSALPGREDDAIDAIDQALDYAIAIGAKNIHVMAGFAKGQDAHNTFVSNLRYACEKAEDHGIIILIEPLNNYDAPKYFLSKTGQAKTIIEEVGFTNIKLMFDCYHVQLMEGDISNRLQKLLPIIGHIQFASVPDRCSPDHGELSYAHIFKTIADMGYNAPLGAEYKPSKPTDETLGWMKDFT